MKDRISVWAISCSCLSSLWTPLWKTLEYGLYCSSTVDHQRHSVDCSFEKGSIYTYIGEVSWDFFACKLAQSRFPPSRFWSVSIPIGHYPSMDWNPWEATKVVRCLNDRHISSLWPKQPIESWNSTQWVAVLSFRVGDLSRESRSHSSLFDVVGESGSGKTEASKIILRYIATVTNRSNRAEIQR